MHPKTHDRIRWIIDQLLTRHQDPETIIAALVDPSTAKQHDWPRWPLERAERYTYGVAEAFGRRTASAR